MQKQTCGYEKKTYNTSIKMVRPMQDSLKSSFQNSISPIQSNDKVIMLLPTSQPFKDIKNKLQEPFSCLKTLTLKLSTIESNLPNTANFFVKKQNLFPISDNVIKICRDRLDYPDWFFFSAWFSSSTLPNLNNKNKKI